MADLKATRRAKCGDMLITKEVSGRVTLVSAYPDESVYLRTGLEMLFAYYPYHKKSGRIMATLSTKKAILHRISVNGDCSWQMEDVLVFKCGARIPLKDLVANQEVLVTDCVKIPPPQLEALDVCHQLFKHGIVRI